MSTRLTPALVLIVLAGLIAPVWAADAPDRPSDKEINQAIEKGIQFLRDQQEDDGSWSYVYDGDHRLGMTALAGLAMLENGVPRDDPAIEKADKIVHDLAEDSDRTYDLTLAILFLARVEPGNRGPNDDLIINLANRLEAGGEDGFWTYTVPKTTRYGRRQEWHRPQRGDNSNTQFALLGTWAAGRHGFDSNPALEALDKHFRSTQDTYGGWGYTSPGSGPFGTNAMTCAGLIGLSIAAARPKLAEEKTARARGAALAADGAFIKALDVVKSDAHNINRSSNIYYLWSLERVCVALGLKDLDGFDWYGAGARSLLDRQQASGAWPSGHFGNLPETCLALLFLRKANLAFELDRVLKLPSPGKEPDHSQPSGELPEPILTGGEDVAVIVRQVDEAKFPEITVDFEVKDPDGSALLTAQKEDFRVTEYDQPVTITRFQGPQSTEVRPTTVVLVLDHSRSMEDEDRIGGLKQAVATFLKVMPSGSRVGVVAFGSDVEVVCPFTSDPKQVQTAVDALTAEGATRYYDAVSRALEMIAKDPEPGRRAVLAMTDGEDTFSQDASLDSVILAARRSGVPVHTLGLGTEEEIESDSLRRLATETRGQYFPARQADQLRGIYEELARGLGSSYSLAYQTNRPLPDGTLRPVKITYRASKKAGEALVFIRGMVVPASGWSRLFLLLVAGLGALALLPGWWARRAAG